MQVERRKWRVEQKELLEEQFPKATGRSSLPPLSPQIKVQSHQHLAFYSILAAPLDCPVAIIAIGTRRTPCSIVLLQCRSQALVYAMQLNRR